MKFTVRAPVYPTESQEKVITAMKNIFPGIEFEVAPGAPAWITGYGYEKEALEQLHFLLRKEKILDACRALLLENKMANKTRLRINKQAAYVGRLNLSAESPLGCIELEIESEELEELIDWLAPKTVDGREP